MKKVLYLFTCLLSLHFTSFAVTNITTATVSGHWTEANSPYIIHNNIVIPAGSSLIIDPGVEVLFVSGVNFTATGLLKAVGTAVKPILFHAQDTTNWSNLAISGGGWGGLSIPYQATPDSTILDYCKIYDLKSAQVYIARPVTISNFELFHCKSNGDLMNLNNYYGTIMINGGNIHDNFVSMATGGTNHKNILYATNAASWGTKMPGIIEIDNMLIHDNSATSIFYMTRVNLMILRANSFFKNSTADNGVLCFSHYDSAYVYNNKIYDNVTNGMAVVFCIGSFVDITSNYICNNRDTMGGCSATQGGGGIHLSGNGGSPDEVLNYTVRNNIIANNTCIQSGGGIYMYHAGANITNNAFVNNSTITVGSAIGIDNTWNTSVIKNNIFWHNRSMTDSTQKCIWSAEGGRYYFDNNYMDYDIHGMVDDWVPLILLGDSTHNIVGFDPMFVAPTTTLGHLPMASLTDNYNVMPGSPCINGGDTANFIPYTNDYIGGGRIGGGKIDIGPYECEGCPWTAPPAGLPTITTASTFDVYPNPTSSSINIILPTAEGVITIADVTGKHLSTVNVKNTILSIDLSTMPKGNYLLIWKQEGHASSTKKILLQ